MIRVVHIVAYDPADGMYLGGFRTTYSVRDFSRGVPSRAARRFMRAMRRHPLNLRVDGEVCPRAAIRIKVDDL